MPAPTLRRGASPTLRPEGWFGLLMRGYRQGTPVSSVTDCTGEAIAWREPTGRCVEPAPESAQEYGRALTEDDLVVVRGTGNQRFVWAITHRFTNGEGMGPVAWAEFTPTQVVVRAIGTLRISPRRVRMRFETLGGHQVLVAEGETCRRVPLEGSDAGPDATVPDGGEGRDLCQRSVRWMPLRNNRFVAAHLTNEGGRCVGPARFYFDRDQTEALDTGWERRFELHTALTYRPAGVVIHEQVVVSDTDPRRPAVPPRVFRRAEADRSVFFTGNNLVATEPSLWYRVLTEHASVRQWRDAGTDGDGGEGDEGDGGTDGGAASNADGSWVSWTPVR